MRFSVKANYPPRYVYICSAGHSGSTLLDLLIGSHSRVASLGEVTHLPKNLSLNTRCGCGQPVRSCSAWTEIVKKMSVSLKIDILKDPYALNLGYIDARVVVDKSHQTPLYNLKRRISHALEYFLLRCDKGTIISLLKRSDQALENNLLLYEKAREVFDADITVDSSKHYLKALGLYRKVPGKLRIILLVRDGRAVLYSGLKRNRSRRQTVFSWKNHYKRALLLFDRYVDPAHILLVKYERLATTPEQELNRICGFLGLDYQEKMLDFSNYTHHVTNGNTRVIFSQSSIIRPDMAWKKELQEIDLNFFEKMAGKLNRKLGYY